MLILCLLIVQILRYLAQVSFVNASDTLFQFMPKASTSTISRKVIDLFAKSLLCLLGWLVFHQAMAQEPVKLIPSKDPMLIGLQTAILKETGWRLSVEQVKDELQAKNFTRSTQQIPSFDPSESGYWIRFQLVAEVNDKWILAIDNAHIQKYDFYLFRDDSVISMQQGGEDYPFNQRAYYNTKFWIDLPVERGKLYTAYIRVENNLVTIAPLRVGSLATFSNRAHLYDLMQGMYFGALLIMSIYNFFLFLSIRQQVYLLYVLSTLLGGLTFADYEGLAYAFLWPDAVILNQYALAITSLSIIFVVLFSSAFLQVSKYLPEWKVVFNGLIGLNIIGMVLIMAEWIQVIYYVHIVSVLTSVVVYAAAVLILRKGNYSARLYLAAWSFLLASIVIYVLRINGVLPANAFTNNVLQIGSFFELSTLSLALADRINFLRHENHALVSLQKTRLEELVAERTAELEQQKKLLEDANLVKNKLFAVISHDFRSPLNSLQGLLHLLEANLLSAADIKQFASGMMERVNGTLAMLDNLLYWSRSKMLETGPEMQVFNLADITEQVIAFSKAQAEKKGLYVENRIPKETLAKGDPEMIRIVVRNLVSNAIKFTKQGGVSVLLGPYSKEMLHVIVEDSGIGIPPTVLPTLFGKGVGFSTLGTAEEKGTGIGLSICQDFIRLNGGQIWATSQEGKGTRFHFTLTIGEMQPDRAADSSEV